jgi:hypothetical protein
MTSDPTKHVFALDLFLACPSFKCTQNDTSGENAIKMS